MKKATLRLIALCLALLCLTACSGEAQTTRKDVTHDASRDTAVQTTPSNAQNVDTPEKERTTLVIASVGGSGSKLNMVINEFNKQSGDYVIELIDYAEDISLEQGKMKLQTQLLAEDRPDMLLFDKYVWFSSGNMDNALSPLPYIARGMLLDLDEYIENDSEMEKDDFIIWDALHEFGGMYVIGPKFWVDGLCCLPETAEQYENWSFEDYLALQSSLSPGQDLIYGISPQSFLHRVTSCYFHELIDIENATCSFDQPEFISMLETACHVNSYNTDEKHMQADNSFKSAPEMLVDGELMFYHVTLYSVFDVSFDRYRSGGIRVWYGEGENPYQDRTGGTEPLGYIGYPTPDGSSGAFIDFPYTVGICAGTKHPEACWEFIRYMLQNQFYQDTYDGTPVLRTELDTCLDFMKKQSAGWKTTTADLDRLVTVAERCDKMGYLDVDILTIIEEEAAEVLAGKRTAEDAAKMIQNRASLLVMERYG